MRTAAGTPRGLDRIHAEILSIPICMRREVLRFPGKPFDSILSRLPPEADRQGVGSACVRPPRPAPGVRMKDEGLADIRRHNDVDRA